MRLVFRGATGQPLASTLKKLISQLSATLEQKVITINERGLTSTQWTVYNKETKRMTYSAVPTSDTTAEAVAVDGFSISQKDNAGITTTAARHYSAEGMTLTQTDGRGNATATETDKAGRTARKGTTVNDTFGYSNRSELTEATVSGAAYSYAYDNIGNRKSAQEAAEEATAYTANALNQYTAVDDFVPTYDADGNQTLVKTSTGIWTVAYNAENRPITFTNNESNTAIECAYDYMGRRATKKVETNGETTLHLRYLYRGYLQIACCDLTRTNHPCLWLITWDPTQPVATRPLAIQKSGTWYCYGWDLTKNICEVFGSNGYINTIYTYTPYGEATSSGSTTQPLQWSSEHADTELSLIYYNYRHYNPIQGNWLGRDSIGESDAWNLYLYTANNPSIYHDTIGQSCMGDCLDDNDYTAILIGHFIAYMLGGPIPKPWVPVVFESLGYPDLARQARVGIRMGKKTITTIPSTLSVALQAGGRSLLRGIGRVVSPVAIVMTALDAMILGYCGWHCLTNDCYNRKKDNILKKIKDKIMDVFS